MPNFVNGNGKDDGTRYPAHSIFAPWQESTLKRTSTNSASYHCAYECDCLVKWIVLLCDDDNGFFGQINIT
uniref:Transposase n=1 Tax=Steinernema glaseri TaxID=37863 RepID=A0A1I8A123_9BILA